MTRLERARATLACRDSIGWFHPNCALIDGYYDVCPLDYIDLPYRIEWTREEQHDVAASLLLDGSE
jgi:hypothetical protein